jgi:hypothetical protein
MHGSSIQVILSPFVSKVISNNLVSNVILGTTRYQTRKVIVDLGRGQNQEYTYKEVVVDIDTNCLAISKLFFPETVAKLQAIWPTTKCKFT